MHHTHWVKAVGVTVLLAGLWPAAAISQTQTQTQTQASSAKPVTRAEVKMDAAEFRRTHRWDASIESWVLKPEFEPPAGVKTRAEVKAERDAFLRTHRWDAAGEKWDPIKAESTVSESRQAVRDDTRQFLKTHEWNDIDGKWVEKARRPKKQ